MALKQIFTVAEVQYLLMYDSDFIRGKYDTGFMDLHLGKLLSLYEEAGGRDESVYLLAVRNPKRYISETSILRLLAYVLLVSWRSCP